MVSRVRVRWVEANLWRGLFTFPVSGSWQLRVTNYGPGYLRRTTVVDDGVRAYPARRAVRGTRRTVVEEEEVAGPGPGAPPPPAV